jgi:hypothetical protein
MPNLGQQAAIEEMERRAFSVQAMQAAKARGTVLGGFCDTHSRQVPYKTSIRFVRTVMKIFLSYGHDKNTPIALRIKKDLEAAGHSVWIDSSEIKVGDDWRRSIVDGLSNSDWTLGLLSQHSVRDPGVCLDELAIALYVKHGIIATVLLEAEAAVSPPISVTHIQWLDMHDWSARLANDGEGGEKWYRSKVDEILALLANPATKRFAGEITELEKKLRPISQEADIGELVKEFIGREWLKSKLDDWRKNARESRLYWISGAPGTGKSSFAAWLAHRGSVNVIGLNLCRYNIDERKDPARVLRTIAFQIATRLPDYRRLLSDRFQKQDPTGSELDRRSVAALFDWLLAEPLRLAPDGGRSSDRYLVVIDALDETIRDGRSALAEVLAESCQKLPNWIAVVVTSRPEPAILRQFAGFKPQVIATESAENLDDCITYVRRWLAIESLGGGETETRVKRIVAAAEGNFLYLQRLREAVTAGLMDLKHPDGLPQGLIGLYERWFRRLFPNPAAYERIRPLLEVLIAAEHPVPEQWLRRIFGWSVSEEARMFESLGSLFERHGNGIAPFHKCLRDWLVDYRNAGADFVVDAAAGSNRLINALWPTFESWTKDAGIAQLDPFCLDELSSQVTRAQCEPPRRDQFIQYLSAPDFIFRIMVIDTDANEDRRRDARQWYEGLVERIAMGWPASIDATVLSKCAKELADTAWRSMDGRLNNLQDFLGWVSLQAHPSNAGGFKAWLDAGEPDQYPQMLPRMRHFFKELNEWEFAILILVSSIRVASVLARVRAELVPCLTLVMDRTMLHFVGSRGWEPVNEIIPATSGAYYIPERNMSFLAGAARNAYDAFKTDPRLSAWVTEWSWLEH